MGSFSADLDHVAVGTTGIDAARDLALRGAGGREVARFTERSWAGLQMAFDGGVRLEFLEPLAEPADDFLVRFLERHGQAPHHVTFKVSDIEAALAGLDRLGIAPLKVDLGDPNWKEAFLHPRLGLGTVVQLAQAGGQWAAETPDAETPPHGIRSALLGAELRADAAIADRVFGDLLGGTRTGPGGHDAGPAVAYAWPGGGTLLVHPAGDAPPALERIVWRILDWPPDRPWPVRDAVLYDGPARLVRLRPDEPWFQAAAPA
jgi:hypothetical protein